MTGPNRCCSSLATSSDSRVKDGHGRADIEFGREPIVVGLGSEAGGGRNVLVVFKTQACDEPGKVDFLVDNETTAHRHKPDDTREGRVSP